MRRPRVPGRLLSVEEYLRFEERASVEHEHVAGRVYALAGVSLTHERIVNTLHGARRPATRGTSCELMTREVRVSVADRIYYPDLPRLRERATTTHDAAPATHG